MTTHALASKGKMPEGERITKKNQYEAVFAKGQRWGNQTIVIRALPNGGEGTRYGLVTGKKLGKAVVRNKVKRRLREILKKMPLKRGWDLVFIARPAAAQVKYQVLRQKIGELLARARLLEGDPF